MPINTMQVRGFDPELWRQLRIRAVGNRRPLARELEEIVRTALAGEAAASTEEAACHECHGNQKPRRREDQRVG